MSITAALIVFAVTWFMVFYMVLPMRFQSQQDVGAVVPGTPKSAPSTENVKKKALVTTGIALVVWAGIVWFITSGVVSGTPKSAPSTENVKKKALVTTGIALVVWAGIVWFITSGVVSVRDLDFRGTLGPETATHAPEATH